MDAQALIALRDVAGIPTHPLVFLILGVATFALHIAAVQITLGASGLTVWGALSSDPHKRRLAQSMVMVAKFMLSVAIVLGVAPLLFVQVTYDPSWYTSNVLSAWWVIGFIIILIVAALLWFGFHSKNDKLGSTPKTFCPTLAILSIVLLLVVGFIMHVLTYQMLSPEKWMSWYAPNGVLDTSGTVLHDYSLPRFLFFIMMSVPVVGAVLVGYRRYYLPRLGDESLNMSREYLDWVGRLGQNLIAVGGVLVVLLGIWWMATLPEKVASFAYSPWAILSLIFLLGFAAFARWVNSGGRMDSYWAYAVLGVGAVAGIVVAIAREILRYDILAIAHGYNPLDYPINMDWYSTILFFVTFLVVGAGALGYLITVAWKAGQTQGVYTPSPAIERIGNIAIWLIALWIVQYFAIGFYIWLS